MTRSSPADNLVDNLKMLLRITTWSNRELSKRSGVSDRMIGKILNRDSIPSIEITDQLAAAFGLSGWQLIMPNLPENLPNGGKLERLVSTYLAASPNGRDYMNQMAEREALYGNSKN